MLSVQFEMDRDTVFCGLTLATTSKSAWRSSVSVPWAPWLWHASVCRTHGTSLIPFRAILRQLGLGSGLRQPGARLRPALPRPRLPPPRAVADAVVGDDHQQRLDERRASLRPRRLDLRRERRHRLL